MRIPGEENCSLPVSVCCEVPLIAAYCFSSRGLTNMAVSLCHKNCWGRTPIHDRSNYREWSTSLKHASTSSVPKVVESAFNSCYFLCCLYAFLKLPVGL